MAVECGPEPERRLERYGLKPAFIAVAVAVALAFAPAPRASRAQEPPASAASLRVLLIGNSYTRFNMLPTLLRRVALSVPGGPQLAVDFEAHGGSTLRRHWLDGRAYAQLVKRRYTHVVLQDHSLRPVDRPDEFQESIARWKQAIDRVHARTVLFATWARHPSARLYREHPLVHSFVDMASLLSGGYEAAADQQVTDLAPVGRAFERALAEQPELALYKNDGAHPTLAGSFLAANVLYGAITSFDPRASTYVPWELGPEQSALVKSLAAEALGRPPFEESVSPETVAGAPPPESIDAVPEAPGTMTTNKPP